MFSSSRNSSQILDQQSKTASELKSGLKYFASIIKGSVYYKIKALEIKMCWLSLHSFGLQQTWVRHEALQTQKNLHLMLVWLIGKPPSSSEQSPEIGNRTLKLSEKLDRVHSALKKLWTPFTHTLLTYFILLHFFNLEAFCIVLFDRFYCIFSLALRQLRLKQLRFN